MAYFGLIGTVCCALHVCNTKNVSKSIYIYLLTFFVMWMHVWYVCVYIFGRLCQCLSLWRIKLKIYNQTKQPASARRMNGWNEIGMLKREEQSTSSVVCVFFSRTITITISQNKYNSFHGNVFKSSQCIYSIISSFASLHPAHIPKN